jgi:FlaA1/EpsC-like NDP-sugar epimerase
MKSSGSCFEIWDRQWEAGEPLTVTDLEALRYMAEKDVIVESILYAMPEAQNALYVLQMPAYKVKELVAQYCTENIKIIGLQPGEKLEEEMHRENEKYISLEVHSW